VPVPKTKPKSKARLAFDLGDPKWVEHAKAPSEKQLAKKPVGTIVVHRGEEQTTVYVKVDETPREWRRATKRTLGSALAHIEEIDERNAKRPDDYEWMSDDCDVATSLEGQPVTMGTIGVSLRVPIARIDAKKVALGRASWEPARVADIDPSADDLGKAYRTKLTTKHGPQANVYVKIGQDDWIHAVTAIDIDEAAEITKRLHEDVKYPRFQRRRDKEIRDWLELDSKNGGELTTSTIAVTR